MVVDGAGGGCCFVSFGTGFWGWFWSILGAFGRFLGGSGRCLGLSWGSLGGLLGVSWGYLGPKSQQVTERLVRWTPLDPPTWDPRGGGRTGVELTFFALGAKMAPRAPKTPPRTPQEPPKSPPRASKTPPRGPSGQILGRFLIDFGYLFG